MKVFKMFLMLLVISGSVDFVKPLNAILKSWSSCGGKKYPNFLHIFNFKHLGDYVHRVDVNLTGEVEFGANLKYKTNIYKNEKKLAINFGGKDVCKGAFAILGDVATNVLNVLRPKVSASCPIKKGVYTARNTVVDAKLIKLPIPLKGNFRIELPISEVATNKDVACIEIVADLM